MSLTFRIGDPLPAERGATGPLFAAGWDAAAWAHWRRRRAEDPLDAGFPGLPPRSEPPGAEAGFAARAEAAGREGHACDDQLVEPGLIAVAVPVHGPDGAAVCAVSVVSHTSRHTVDSLRAAVFPELRRTVAAMERTLREAPPPPAAPPAPADGRGPVPEGVVTVESFARGLAVLAAFDAGRVTPTLSELAAATGLPRATVRRALITLGHLGYTEPAGRGFRPTPRVLELGFAALARRPLAALALPHLAALTARVNDSASMAVLDGSEIRYVARVPTVRIMSVNITVGTRFPALATSMGRVLLAGLPAADRAALLPGPGSTPPAPGTPTASADPSAAVDRAAADGFALVDQELEVGLRSVAVPVRDHRGTVVAAVNVSTHAGRRTPQEILRDVLPELRAAAAGIEGDLREAGRFVRVGLS
jgi:IclR family transcriptional regulator, pca regulon regulatory protein